MKNHLASLKVFNLNVCEEQEDYVFPPRVEKILPRLKLNDLFKNPLGLAGKCIVTKLKTGCSSCKNL